MTVLGAVFSDLIGNLQQGHEADMIEAVSVDSLSCNSFFFSDMLSIVKFEGFTRNRERVKIAFARL